MLDKIKKAMAEVDNIIDEQGNSYYDMPEESYETIVAELETIKREYVMIKISDVPDDLEAAFMHGDSKKAWECVAILRDAIKEHKDKTK